MEEFFDSPKTPIEDKDLNGISFMKAIFLLLFIGCIFFSGATLLGYKFFWYQPEFESPEEYRLDTALMNVKKYPGNADLRVELGWNYMQQGNFKLAKEEFKNALKIEPEHFGATLNLGIIYGEEGDFNKSEKYLKKTLVMNKAAQDVHLALGQLFMMKKEYENAIKEFNYLLDMNPGTVDFIFKIGNAYEKSGDIAGAKKQYEKVLTYVPEHPQAKSALRHLKEGES